MIHLIVAFPDVLFAQVCLNWIDLIDISHLDIAVCNLTYRSSIWKIISTSSLLSPMNMPHKVIFFESYWSWLLDRKLCIRNFVLRHDNDIVLLNRSLLKRDLIDANKAVDNNSMIHYESVKELSIHSSVSVCDELIIITKYLKNLEILHLSCFQYHEYLYDSPLLEMSNYTSKLKSLSFSTATKITEVSLRSMLSANHNTLIALDISYCIGITFGLDLLRQFSNLIELNIMGCMVQRNDYIALSLFLTKLENLSIGGYSTSNVLSDDLIQNIMPCFSKLTYLLICGAKITGEGLLGVLPQSLTSLNFLSCRIMTLRGLNSALSNNLSNVTNFRLFGVINLRNNIDELRILPMRRLTSLILSVLRSSFFDNHLNLLLSDDNISELEFLNLSNNHYITAESCKDLHFPNLMVLDISYCSRIANNGLCNILLKWHMSNLTKLNISHLHKLTGQGLSGLFPQSLTNLDLSNCPMICSEGLCEIFSNNHLSNLTELKMNQSIVNLLLICPSLPVSLVTLSMAESSKLSDENLNQLLSNNLTNLLHLNIAYCIEIKGDGLLSGIFPESLTKLNLNGINMTENNLNHIFTSNNLTNLTMLELTDYHNNTLQTDFIKSHCNNKYLKINWQTEKL
eukprot:gene13642-18306_t